MSKIVVTGCAGLIGSHFTRHLLSRGHEVVGVDNLSGGHVEHVPPEVTFYKADVTHADGVNDIFNEERPDFVYHFSAYAAVGLSPFIRNFNYMNNVVGSANVINACVNSDVKKVVFTSSMDVYGSQVPPFDETMTPRPEDPYGIAKYAVEQDLHAAGRFFGLRYSIVRPHNVFGVYQNIWDKYRNVLGIWIRQILSGRPMTIYGDGSQVRSFSDVRCYMSPLEKLMSMGDGETYNVGADRHMTIAAAANSVRMIAAKLGHKAEVVHLEPRDEVRVAFCDHAKAKTQLGFQDDTDFEKLVEDMFIWAVGQPDRPVKTMSCEVKKNLYSFWRE